MADAMVIIGGLIVGILFGYVMQRGRFCMNSAIRDPLVFKDYNLMKAVGLIVTIEMIAFALITRFDTYSLAPVPLMWGAQILGGYVFGIGMVLAGGCASGTTYKTGEGLLGSFIALMGLALGAYITGKGILFNFKTAIQTATMTSVTGIAGDATWIVMLVIGILGLGAYVWFFLLPYFKENKISENFGLKKTWGWPMTGIGIALVGIINLLINNAYLGITKGWLLFLHSLVDDSPTGPRIDILNWMSWMVFGIVIGAFIAAKIAGEWKLSTPRKPIRIIQSLSGGLLMGFGAVLAGGCNITQIISGIPQLSLGSIVASISLVLGSWTASYFRFMRDN
ncbi:MAG: YeeE/YedE family protein [Promethearchaeota archaeon]